MFKIGYEWLHLKELDIELFHLELRQYYLQIARKKNLTASEFWTLVRPYIILKLFFINTYYLPSLSIYNGKTF